MSDLERFENRPLPPQTVTGNRLYVLFAVAANQNENAHGETIREFISEMAGRSLVHSRVYRKLSRLNDEGYIEKKRSLLDARAYNYSLTEKGRAEIVAHHRWERECLERGGIDV